MEGEKGGKQGGESAAIPEAFGGRKRFTVELRPDETTIVSWKKLLKDASKGSGSTSVPEPPPPNAHQTLESRIAPGQPAEKDLMDAPPGSRFSAVIEKIERLYMGKHSSDEEDLSDVPDDDEYDTEDSFIDDKELDEYFQVDNSAVKHDGFFVNRGTLERINEPTLSPHQQLKKRKRKETTKGIDDGHVPNKQVKVRKKAAGRSPPLDVKNSSSPSHGVPMPTDRCEDVKSRNQMNASAICSKKKSADTKTTLDVYPSSKVSNGGATLSPLEGKDFENKKIGVLSKNHGNKLKDGTELSDASHQKSRDKSSYPQLKSEPGKLLNNVDELEQSVQRKEKDGSLERLDINVPQNVPIMHKKEGSSVRPKSTMLEKAIRELEKMVAESRRPTTEVLDADISSQTVKKRLPHEVKQKLAKVARLAQATHGKISTELINRLLSILGHWIQLRSLKRNLQVMVSMGLSAKQQKDDRFQQIKKEVVEMIKVIPPPKAKALEHQAGASDDFQEIGNEKKEVPNRKYCMDEALEEKICDLYDLFVEGLEEVAGPQVRKLYVELAELWPNGDMDNHGIKRAICRAKNRRKAKYSRQKDDQERMKKKKLLTQKTEGSVRVEANSMAQPQQEKLVTNSGHPALTSLKRPVTDTTSVPTAVRVPSSSANGPSLVSTKQEKIKGSSGNYNDARMGESSTKKKVKRKPEMELGDVCFHQQKLTSAPGEERHKSQKQVGGPLQKQNFPSAAPTN